MENSRHSSVENKLEKLSVIFTVVPRRKSELYIDVLEVAGANFQMQIFASGTVQSHVSEILGLADTEKQAIISVVKNCDVEKVMDRLNEKFSTVKGGGGIAFSVPMKSIIGVYAYNFLANNGKVTLNENK